MEDILGLEDIWERRDMEVTKRVVVVAWHKSQDGLSHLVKSVAKDTLVKYKSGPKTGHAFYTTQWNTVCGWTVYSMPGEGPSLKGPAIVTCLECAASCP